MTEDELKHAGVMGMHWHVTMGKHTTLKGRGKSTSAVKGSSASADAVTAAKIKRKKISEMSNEEIKTITTRIQLEQQYKTLNPSKVARGAKIARNLLATAGMAKMQDLTNKNLSKLVNMALAKAAPGIVT